MKTIDFNWLKNKTISIVGLSKNSGKTTTLNAIINQTNGRFSRIGITSIGRDGENEDIAIGNTKPRINVKKNTIIATTESLVDHCDVSKNIVYSTDYTTPMGRVYLIETMSDGYVQIAGPSSVSQMINLKKVMQYLNCECIFVDGASSRRSLGYSKLADGIVICSSANLSSNINDVVEATSFVASLYDLPISKEDDGMLISDAITDTVISKLLSTYKSNDLRKVNLVFEDPSKIMCSSNSFMLIKSKVNAIKFCNKPRLLAVSINPTSVYGWKFNSDELVKKISKKVNVPVFDVLME